MLDVTVIGTRKAFPYILGMPFDSSRYIGSRAPPVVTLDACVQGEGGGWGSAAIQQTHACTCARAEYTCIVVQDVQPPQLPSRACHSLPDLCRLPEVSRGVQHLWSRKKRNDDASSDLYRLLIALQA